MGAIANAVSIDTAEEPASSASVQNAMSPPPIDALNRLVTAGILTQDLVDAVLDLYYNPGDELEANWIIWELLKALGRIYIYVKMGVEALKDAQAVSDWVCENFDDNGCGNGYHVPSFTGGGLQ